MNRPTSWFDRPAQTDRPQGGSGRRPRKTADRRGGPVGRSADQGGGRLALEVGSWVTPHTLAAAVNKLVSRKRKNPLVARTRRSGCALVSREAQGRVGVMRSSTAGGREPPPRSVRHHRVATVVLLRWAWPPPRCSPSSSSRRHGSLPAQSGCSGRRVTLAVGWAAASCAPLRRRLMTLASRRQTSLSSSTAEPSRRSLRLRLRRRSLLPARGRRQRRPP